MPAVRPTMPSGGGSVTSGSAVGSCVRGARARATVDWTSAMLNGLLM
jgi:hypothetical protein